MSKELIEIVDVAVIGAGEPTDYAAALTLTANQQAQMGLFCGSALATPTSAIRSCAEANRGALRVRIPADG